MLINSKEPEVSKCENKFVKNANLLDKSFEELFQRIYSLQNIISPILLPESSQPDEKDGAIDSKIKSEYEVFIDSTISRIDSAKRIIEDMIQRSTI